LKGQRTVSEITSEYPNQVSQWKKKALEGMAESFARGKSNEVESPENLELMRLIDEEYMRHPF